MTDKDKAPEIKAPNPATVERAQEKVEEGKDLNQREEQAFADQQALDRQRGFTEEEWKPGIRQFRSLITGHTTPDERSMVQYHNELGQHGVVDPRQ